MKSDKADFEFIMSGFVYIFKERRILMEKVAVAMFSAISSIGVAYIVAAMFVGADTLIPHRYIVITSDGKKYATNKKPS